MQAECDLHLARIFRGEDFAKGVGLVGEGLRQVELARFMVLND